MASSSIAAGTPRPAAASLAFEHAHERAERVRNVRYELDLEMRAADYGGEVAISFELQGPERDLTVDFTGGALGSVTVNGRAVAPQYNGFFVTLPAAALAPGANRVVVTFSHPYSADGSGLYRFTDPEDGRTYCYTDFEPYNHNRLFPSFDQPNIKARYTTRVTVPADWHVVSVVAESSVSERAGSKVWTFPESPPISPYVFALHTGQYHVWESSAERIPLRLFARASLARYIAPDEWFLLTRQGFAFFERYFDLPYPFHKYDQLIVPHFNFGAMENVGAVTFTERFVRRGAITREQRRQLASVLLHEMAHMWFGDLVTMDWWNGLWLNESFATFMSTLAMAQGTEFTDELESAYRSSLHAYRADERDTTHPIELPVPDTNSALSNFDAITYEKGSATLKQLSHLVGPEAFRRGVADYLKRHAYGNTRIADFFGAISRAAGRDLGEWEREWLHEPGLNTVTADVRCENGRVASLDVVQTAPRDWPTLRTHRTQLGLYRFGAQGVEITTVPVTYSGQRTRVATAAGAACPDLVFANHGDWDYVHAPLDPAAVAVLDGKLRRFDDALLRSMLWQGVWELVLHAQLPPQRFVEFVLANLPSETNDGALQQVIASLQLGVNYLRLCDAEDLRSIEAAVEEFLWRQATDSDSGSDRQLVFFDAYVEAAATPSAIERLEAILDERTSPPPGVRLDQDRRWNALLVLARVGHADIERRVDRERERDPSDQGRLRWIAARAAQPVLEVKRAWLTRVLDGSALALADLRAASPALFPAAQHALHAALAPDILDGVAKVNRVREQSYFGSFVAGFLGPICDTEYLRRLETAIREARGLHPILNRGLRNSRFEVARCLSIAESIGRKKKSSA